MATASRSSAPERAQTSPTAVLVAVAAIGMGLSLHAGVLASVAPAAERDVADPTLDRVHDAVTAAGVADPKRLEQALAAGPDGYELRITLRVDDRIWTAGAIPPSQVDSAGHSKPETATRRVAVRTGPGTVAAGQLQVVVWR